jgi:ADP-heptose:LPS heptosyltransferase/GT2 family glycosyltransferase
MARKTTAPSKETKAPSPRRGKRAAPDADTLVMEAVVDEAAIARAETQAAQAQPVLNEPVLIEMDTFLSCGAVSDRFDISLRGRIVSAHAVVELRLQVDGEVIASASYGQPERAMVGMMPDGTPGRYRGFQFNLPRLGPATSGTVRFDLVACIEGGSEHAEVYELEYDGMSGRVTVLSGRAVPGAGGGAVKPHCIVYVERATLDLDGGLTVNGWAVAMGPVLALQVFAGDDRLGTARYGDEREDVGAVHYSYPDAHLSGFMLTTTLSTRDRDATTVRVQMVCPDGFGQDETTPIERVQRHGQAGPRIQGTPRPLGREAPPPSFALLQDRPNYALTAEFRIEEEPLIGLVLSTPATRAAAAGPAPAAPVPLPSSKSSEIRMFCDQSTLTGDGYLEVSGWAVCAIGVAQVRVSLDDQFVGLAAHGHDRPDVGAAFPDILHAGLSGFRFRQRVGDSFTGEHGIRVVVRNLSKEEKEDTLTVTATVVETPVEVEAIATAEAATARDGADIDPMIFTMTAEQMEEFRFELDSPVLVAGHMPELVTGRLTIDGWLLTQSGIESFEVYLDDQRLGDMHYGLARQDVGAAFPDWPNSVRSGYAFHCPPRSLRDGAHLVRLSVKAKSGVTVDRQFGITVKKSEEHQEQSGIRRRVPRVEADMMLALLDAISYRPRFRFILAQDQAIDLDGLTRTLDAIRLQAYEDWSVLMLASEPQVAAALGIMLKETMPHLTDRFEIRSPGEAWDTSLGAEAGRGVLHVMLRSGDEPGADALLELAVAMGRHPESGMAYGDETRLSPISGEWENFYKPDFSPDLLTATNYIGRPCAVTDAVLARTGVTAQSLLEQGDYDLILRCVEAAGTVRHIPKLLCQRGDAALDTDIRERAALEQMLVRREIAGSVIDTAIPGTYRLKRALKTKGMVSIIIPTCGAGGFIEACLNSLRKLTTYDNYEIIVIDNIPAAETKRKDWLRENADKIVDIPDAFNWSIFNNKAAAVAAGEFLLFLNDDITITQPDWLEAMLENGQRPEVGLVGPQLLYPDGKVQHAGMFLATPGIGRHAFRFASYDDPCYFGLALTQRNVMAVTGACMLVRREVFERLGRFDEAHQIVNNDLDFCLRVHKAGLLTVYTPYASMTHHELASRAQMKDVFDLTHFNAQWHTTFTAGDPYFNPRLWRHADDYRADEEGVQTVVSGSPLFHREEIKRILVVKLDHIGDFVTALPPIRKLKSLFPQAHITVLAGPASKAFVAMEPAIDAFIPFSFFHARSQLGERELTQDDFEALARELKPHRFDLAVDLRKHPSTRDILKYTGARFLAGFDFQGQYPNLDIALDWDGDRTLQRKRNHIVVDLMALVNAVGHAAESDRRLMKAVPGKMPRDKMPADVAKLFDRRVIAVHPGAGNITKQWPEHHFAALIDLLIEQHDVNVVMVGGPDEVEIAENVWGLVLHQDRVASMTGKTSLAALPAFLGNCVLYIGNDSGPKHVAAAAGLPTIGIHSGVVDPVEWGPIGESAVALRRNMTCSPCYLAKAEDCPRGLACLRYLEPNLVYETADTMLARTPAPATAAPPRRRTTRKTAAEAETA